MTRMNLANPTSLSCAGAAFLLMIAMFGVACSSILGIEPGVFDERDDAGSDTAAPPAEGGQVAAPAADETGSVAPVSPFVAGEGDAGALGPDAGSEAGVAAEQEGDGDAAAPGPDAGSEAGAAADEGGDADATVLGQGADAEGDATAPVPDADFDGELSALAVDGGFDTKSVPRIGDDGGDATESADATSDTSSAPDQTVDGEAIVPLAARLIAPLSTSLVTSRQPTLRWTLPDGISDATIDVCLDRACTNLVLSTHVNGTSYAPAAALPIGVVYWRVHSSTMTDVTSSTWQFTVGRRSSPIDTSWGTTLDVNGDGYADVAVSAYNATGGQDAAGKVYVYLGGPSGLATLPVTLRNPGTIANFFGWSVASAGDVNGDGYGDLAVGARGGSPTVAGGVYVYLGSPDGLATTPIALSDPNGVPGASFGQSVAGAGDLNGDGYGDIVVGAPLGSNAAGSAYVYYGTPLGVSSLPAMTLRDPQGGANDYFGTAVASAGDVNGDGYVDYVIGANGVAGSTGIAYLYLGGPNHAAGNPIAVSDPGNAAGDAFATSVALAGDINADGYADFIVGSSNVPTYDGNAYVYLGGASGPRAPLVLTDPAAMPNDFFGGAVAGAGDLNGDGYADVAVGAFGANATGRVYVYFGGSAGPGDTPVTLVDPRGTAGDSFGRSVASAGDVNGSGYPGLVVGAPAFGTAAQVGAAYLYPGNASALKSVVTLFSPAGAGAVFGLSVFGATN